MLLSEFTIVRTILLCAKKEDVYLFNADPIFPPAHCLLGLAARVLRRMGRIQDISLLDEHAATSKARMALFPRLDWYARTEEIFINQLQLDCKCPAWPQYDYAARKQSTNYGAEHLMILHFMQELYEKAPNLHLVLHGCSPIIEKIQERLECLPFQTEFKPCRYPRRLVNASLAVMAICRAALQVCRSIKLKPKPRRRVFLAIDAIDNPDRMIPLVNDVLNDVEQQGLYIFRNKTSYERLRSALRDYPVSPYPDGQFGIPDCAYVCGRAIVDAIRLFRRFGTLDPPLFLQIVKLSASRVHFEGLFNKYDIAYFLARDEYNAEHIIRTQELRRRGAVSLGLLNGVNLFGIDSVFRFCDYDITFVSSPGPYLQYNRDNWRCPEGVRQIGAIAMSRKDIHEMLKQPKSKNIVCFAKNYCDGPVYLDEIFKIARAFPDRELLISLKKSAVRIGGYEEFVSYLEKAPANVRLVDDGSFELIKRHRYVISGESSIVTETINLGCVTFFLDTYPAENLFVYRNYPELSHSTGDAIAQRIAGIERGTWRYPIENFAELSDITGELAADTIRRTMGLSPKDPPVLSAYREVGRQDKMTRG